jgi:DNA-directed RNA polymerase subunit RPC12/RpoP
MSNGGLNPDEKYCSSCGQIIKSAAEICPKCGVRVMGMPVPPPMTPGGGVATVVPNHLVKAILVTIFCCLPFGIVSIIFSSQVNSKLALGDVNGAIIVSNKANLWANIGLIIGLAQLVIGAIYFFVVGVAMMPDLSAIK